MAKYCPSCGRSIPFDARVCPYCRKLIEVHAALVTPEPKKEKDKTILIIVVVLVVLLILPIAIAATVYFYVSGILPDSVTVDSTPFLWLDKENHTLIVNYVYPSDLQWKDVMVTSGNATLPSGIIDEGDTVTSCNGTVTLVWASSNRSIGTWIFT